MSCNKESNASTKSTIFTESGDDMKQWIIKDVQK